MSSLLILGDTSGSVLLQAPAVAGSGTVTLPTTGGTVRTTTTPGTILQVVQGTLSSQASTTSTSYVTTGMSASITPSSSSNKILILVTGMLATSNGKQVCATIYRNSTDLAASARGFMQLYNGAGELQTGVSANYLDSPATTSSITYTVYMKNVSAQSQTCYWAYDSVTCSIILQEIAG
jgi:hypothetical protein